MKTLLPVLALLAGCAAQQQAVPTQSTRAPEPAFMYPAPFTYSQPSYSFPAAPPVGSGM
jgi:hypothetical protein